MIQFNEVRVTQDNKCLIVDVQISPLDYFANVYLNSISIGVLKSDNCSSVETIEPICEEHFVDLSEDNVKRYRNTFDVDGIKSIFIINVTTKGEVSEGASCCWGKVGSVVTTYAYNKYPLYQAIMPLLNSIGGCEPSRELIDQLLQLQAFNLSLQVGDYCQAVTYWDQFLGNITEKDCSKPKKPCGCNGRTW